jgi:hypothetical protein
MSHSALLHRSSRSHRPAGVAVTEGGLLLPPAPVRVACGLWVVAVAAGALETKLAIGRMLSGPSFSVTSAGEIAAGLAVRIPVFVAALYAAWYMRCGRGWARLALTLGLGVLGTASLVVQPIQTLLQRHSIGWELSHARALDLAFGLSRVVHVSAVLAAVVLMFLPAANAYFRHGRSCRARRG